MNTDKSDNLAKCYSEITSNKTTEADRKPFLFGSPMVRSVTCAGVAF